MEIINYNVVYFSTSIYFYIIFWLLFFLLTISASLAMIKRVIEIENENQNIDKNKNNISTKTILLSLVISLFLLIGFFSIYKLTKKPHLFVYYTNNNINQEIPKNKKEIINDIINENVSFGHIYDFKYHRYEFEITEEEASQLKEAQKKFDKRNKEIEQENENKRKTGNVKFTD